MSTPILSLATFLVFPVFAQATPAVDAPQVAAPQTAQPAANPQTTLNRTPRLGFLSLKTEGTQATYGAGLTESLATWANQTGVFRAVSPTQLQALLAHERKKDLLGQCTDAECYRTVGALVHAPHLVVGSLALVGGDYVMNLALIDTQSGEAISRAARKERRPEDILKNGHKALTILLQPLLSERQGALVLQGNADVYEAAIEVDGRRRAERPGQPIMLSAGPHVLRVYKDGFYAVETDLKIQERVTNAQRITLIPAQETIEAYESKASWMRSGAIATLGLAVASGVVAAVYYGRASDDIDAVSSYSSALRENRTPALDAATVDGHTNSFSTNQGVYIAGLTTAVLSAGVSTYLWLKGGAPNRYAQVRGRTRSEVEPITPTK